MELAVAAGEETAGEERDDGAADRTLPHPMAW